VKTVRPEPDDGGLRRYLLGLLPEAEAEALEEAYLAQPEVWERVRGVEDDLLDDYAADRLAPGDKTAFEERYLASPPLRQRVMAARTLRRALAERDAPAVPRVGARRGPRWTFPVGLAAGLLVAAAVAYRLWPAAGPPTASASPQPSTEVGTPAAASSAPRPSERDTTVTATLPVKVVLALSPVLLRSEQSALARRIPAGTDTVVLELEGDPALLPARSTDLEAAVATVEGAAVWRGPADRARGASAAMRSPRLASVDVPVSVLPPGDYVVTLSAPGQESIQRYFLRIAR
jgi:hypothetical protein